MTAQKSAIVLLNGYPPSEDLISKYWFNADLKICADGAAEYLKDYDKSPDIIIGDFDSIPSEVLRYFESAKIIKLADQNSTDSEKALNYCLKNKIKSAVLLGALGDRCDHGFYNAGLLKKYHKNFNELKIVTEKETLTVIEKSIQVTKSPGTTISLLPIFGPVSGVSTEGLAYDVKNADFELGEFSSVSNCFLSTDAKIEMKSGQLLMIIGTSEVSC